MFFWPFGLVGSSGLEPPTSRLSGVCSNLLSYEPKFDFAKQNQLAEFCFEHFVFNFPLENRKTLQLLLHQFLLSAFCLSCPWWR